MNIILFIILLLSIFTLFTVFIISCTCRENWSNGYSGWPGPIENGSGIYNIPALYPNPKYSANCSYKYNTNSNTGHIRMKDYPNCGKDDLYLSF